MRIEMMRVQIIGLKRDCRTVIRTLQALGSVQIEDIREAPDVAARPLSLTREDVRRQEDVTALLSQVEGLIETLKVDEEATTPVPQPADRSQIAEQVQNLRADVNALVSRRDALQAELDTLPRYEATLRKLLPIVPASAQDPDTLMIGVFASKAHAQVLDEVRRYVQELTGGRTHVVAGDIDASTRAMLFVFPEQYADDVEELLSREDVSRLRLPDEYVNESPETAIAAMERRRARFPAELAQLQHELDGLAQVWASRLLTWRDALEDEVGQVKMLSRLGETEATFVLVGWMPRHEYDALVRALGDTVGETIAVSSVPLTEDLNARMPVLLDNPVPARPFESLVGLLGLPQHDTVDPTRLMALFFPIFFGLILGDVGYGILLLIICLWLLRRFPSGLGRDVLIALAFGSAWGIVFGVLFGEYFGSLGEHFGLHPLWFDRASADYVPFLLGLTIMIGAGHITLGLLIGLWEAIRERSRNELLERAGMLIGLIATFLVVGVLTEYLPQGFMTPALAAIIVGIVLLAVPMGWIGILIGPIEYVGLIGNVLSYLRIAAIGLASVFLARVANELAGVAGNIIVGIVIAVLIHALNIALGAFSPSIQSLRLHYVEFFRKFYHPGGRPYQPFRRRAL